MPKWRRAGASGRSIHPSRTLSSGAVARRCNRVGLGAPASAARLPSASREALVPRAPFERRGFRVRGISRLRKQCHERGGSCCAVSVIASGRILPNRRGHCYINGRGSPSRSDLKGKSRRRCRSLPIDREAQLLRLSPRTDAADGVMTRISTNRSASQRHRNRDARGAQETRLPSRLRCRAR
jgi:hypothetical protein